MSAVIQNAMANNQGANVQSAIATAVAGYDLAHFKAAACTADPSGSITSASVCLYLRIGRLCQQW